jgi:hypothetical protein
MERSSASVRQKRSPRLLIGPSRSKTLIEPMYRHIKYGDIDVSYLHELDGGGMTFGRQYVKLVRDRVGPVDHLFEYCAGPGFIGFSLLASGLCKRLTLADLNPAAVAACRDTIRRNGLDSVVKVHLSDCLDSIPESERWDLVVSNPPHWPGTLDDYRDKIRLIDPDFIVHRKFYRDIPRFLAGQGAIILQENGHATRPADFLPMIEESGLEVVEVLDDPRGSLFDHRLLRAVPRPSFGFSHRLLAPIERALITPRVERLVKDNAVYRRIQELPLLTPSPFYFIWSKPREPRRSVARPSSPDPAGTTGES